MRACAAVFGVSVYSEQLKVSHVHWAR